jgi:hypothetical protein
VFWFSPFAWWLFIRLGELAEAVSDDAAIAGLDGDRDGYADVLVEMAAAPQRLPAGIAMAHPRTVIGESCASSRRAASQDGSAGVVASALPPPSSRWRHSAQ